VADAVADDGAARVAGLDDFDAVVFETLVQEIELSAFAGPVDAVEDDEFASEPFENVAWQGYRPR